MILWDNQIGVELQETMGGDSTIASAAWTSSLDRDKKKKRTEEDIKRVVNMLADSKHSVPFESVIFRFWFKIPIVVDRQFMTHRIASHSGMSGRYRTMPNEYLAIPKDVMDIFDKVKFINDPYCGVTRMSQYYEICDEVNNAYQITILLLKEAEQDGLITNAEMKRAREFYRGILPQHNMTERVTIMNLRSFANFIKLRNSIHAQPEIRKAAEMMLQIVKDSNVCPIAIEALERNGWNI